MKKKTIANLLQTKISHPITYYSHLIIIKRYINLSLIDWLLIKDTFTFIIFIKRPFSRAASPQLQQHGSPELFILYSLFRVNFDR